MQQPEFNFHDLDTSKDYTQQPPRHGKTSPAATIAAWTIITLAIITLGMLVIKLGTILF